MTAPRPWNPEIVEGGTPPESFVLRLYVSGMTERSEHAITALRAICERYLRGHYSLEIVDITRDASRLEQDEIVAAPTLVKESPPPVRRMVGDMSQREKVLSGLGLKPETTG
jgi:circadian clock protein KaiB